ncbi:hypothetical protein ACWCW2_16460 [Streptomyces sp. NPDC001773]
MALLTSALPTKTGAPSALAPGWAEALEWASPQVRNILIAVAERARDGRIAVPEVGYEYGDQALLAELAWPDEKVAIFIDTDAARTAAFESAGW